MNQQVSSRFSTNFQNYVFSVRGGYNRNNLETERLRQVEIMKSEWSLSIEDVRRTLQLSGDPTYPQCYPELQWDLPNSGTTIADRYKRKLIESFVRRTCKSSVQNTYVQLYKQVTGKSVDETNIINELVLLSGALVSQGTVTSQQKLLTADHEVWTGLDYCSKPVEQDRRAVCSSETEL